MRRITIFLFLLFSVLAFGRAQAPVDALNIAPGQSQSFLLFPERSAHLSLNLANLEAGSIIVDAAVPDIDYKLLTGDDSEISSGHLATSGWTVISFAAAGLRQVHLQLSVEDATEDLPGLRVRVELRAVSLVSMSAETRASGLFASAQALHRSLHAEDLGRAIDFYQQASGEWRACGDLYAAALALSGKAESQTALSRYDEALETLAQASKLAADHIYLRGMLLHAAANIYLDLWEGEKASVPAQEELRLGRQIQDDGLIALADADLAGVSFWTDFQKSAYAAKQARTEAVANGVPEALGLEGKWMGWIDELAEDHSGTLSALNESEAAFQQAGDPRAAVQGELEIASATTIEGDHYSALLKFQELDTITKKMGNLVLHGLVLGNMGDIYRQLGKPQTAAGYYKRTVAIFFSTGFWRGRAQNLIDLCEAELDGAKGIGAVAQCTIALTAAQKVGYSGYIGQAKCDLGIAERRSAGDRTALPIIEAAVADSSSAQDRRVESTEHIQLGEILQKSGKADAALEEFTKAKGLSETIADPASLVDAHYAVAQWRLRVGEYETAATELRAALDKIEDRRSSVGSRALQASYFAAEQRFYELGVDLSMQQFHKQNNEDYEWRALGLSEQSHARGLLDALSAKSPETAHAQTDVEKERTLSSNSLNRAFDHRLRLLVEGGDSREFQNSNDEMTEAIAAVERADEQATPPHASTMTADAIREASRNSHTAFFEYELGTDRSYLWVVYGGKIDSYTLPARDELQRKIDKWRFLAAGAGRSTPDASDKLRSISARLSCDVLADAVKPGMTRILIVPDGSLAMLPFEALPEHGCPPMREEPLIVGHEIVEAPSLSVFYSGKHQSEKTSYLGELAIVADPVFDADDSRWNESTHILRQLKDRRASAQQVVPISRLINTGYEAKAIEHIVGNSPGTGQIMVASGFKANVDTVIDPNMRNYRVWHLATHGFYDQSMPELSGLVFSRLSPDGRPRSGFLNTYDIADLDVRAELVVLDACDSGAGEILSGEGVMGLSYAFLRAGATQVISTLWSVDDASSKDLMVAFYKELMQNRGDTATALRKAQLTLMRRPDASAPYYWAGFELTSIGQ
ncbi:MAG: CHAT domain-containing protein [Terracidiphilus sp.]|jgi:CHAT domain-containing protein/tetratricopeptide (TPR) repeat protein